MLCLGSAKVVMVYDMTEIGATEPNIRFPESVDLKALLEHSRTQFQYHAKQRIDSIRYFFIAYGLFANAYLGVISRVPGDQNSNSISVYLAMALGFTAVLISLGFWGLDYRNAQIIHHAEAATRELESSVASHYGISKFRMIERWEYPEQFRRYSNIMNILYAYMTVLSVIAAVYPIVSLCGAPRTH